MYLLSAVCICRRVVNCHLDLHALIRQVATIRVSEGLFSLFWQISLKGKKNHRVLFFLVVLFKFTRNPFSHTFWVANCP